MHFFCKKNDSSLKKVGENRQLEIPLLYRPFFVIFSTFLTKNLGIRTVKKKLWPLSYRLFFRFFPSKSHCSAWFLSHFFYIFWIKNTLLSCPKLDLFGKNGPKNGHFGENGPEIKNGHFRFSPKLVKNYQFWPKIDNFLGMRAVCF